MYLYTITKWTTEFPGCDLWPKCQISVLIFSPFSAVEESYHINTTKKHNKSSSIQLQTFLPSNGSYIYIPLPLMPRKSINSTQRSIARRNCIILLILKRTKGITEMDWMQNIKMSYGPHPLSNKSAGDNEGDIDGVPAHNNSVKPFKKASSAPTSCRIHWRVGLPSPSSSWSNQFNS